MKIRGMKDIPNWVLLSAFSVPVLAWVFSASVRPSGVGAATSQIPQQCVGSASATAQTCTTVLGITSGDVFVYTPGANNSGALTLNFNSTGAKAVQKWLGGALAANDMVSGKPVLASTDGTNVYVMTIGNAPSGSGTTTVASGSLALGTGSISAGTCNTETPPTATGVVSTDIPEWSANADISATTGYAPGQLTIYTWPGSNVVNIKECNGTASPITPSAVTLNWHVTR